MADTIRYSIEDLLTLMSRLRDPVDGCPWDQQQTYRTIAPSTLEEAYEVVDAIERDNHEHLREELGDLLFQVIFYAQLAAEEQRFNFSDIVSDLVTKLIRRHPHVFPAQTLNSRAGDSGNESTDALKAQWETLKQDERNAKGQQGILDDVPLGLPALTRAAKLQKRAANVGFDWSSAAGVLAKLDEEVAELKQAVAALDNTAIAAELGDLLFVVVNLCRHLKVEPEGALRGTNSKFEMRFRYIEQQLSARGLTPEAASMELMDQLWDAAKREGL